MVRVAVHRSDQQNAVQAALESDRHLLVVARNPEDEQPFQLGTVAAIVRMLRLPDGATQLLVQGLDVAVVDAWMGQEESPQAKLGRVPEPSTPPKSVSTRALGATIRANLERLAALGRPISGDVLKLAQDTDDPLQLAYLAAANIDLGVEAGQQVLEATDPIEKMRLVGGMVGVESEMADAEQELHEQTRSEFDRSHRESFLRRQLRAIRAELSEGDWAAAELTRYREQMEALNPPDAVREEFERQLERLERAHPESIETNLLRNHLDALVAVPWGKSAEESLDLEAVSEVLDRHHYGLAEPKQRLLEFLAVRRLNPDAHGPILCLLGPPGVGKTSLGKSVAEATGRPFVQAALGGVHDEAEIRGHRRTYVGALPGRIVLGLIQAQADNPVFVLDEIDKLASDFRGDSTSALLEVLDPEQNHAFRDHFLGVGVDLSRVLFLTTANQADTIPIALRDRLEILPLSGYSPEEKLAIARRHLLPKQVVEAGLKRSQVRFSDASLRLTIRDYTREAGVRQLDRELARVCRKRALEVVTGETDSDTPWIGKARLRELLGPPRHTSEEMLDRARVGVATGLAWTPVGGDILVIEATAVPGSGSLVLTGNLGEVMRESAQAALTHVRTRCQEDHDELFANHDFHIHVPAGAIPKDGPSAGITIATALHSLATDRPVDHRLAMTGELTLRGEVLSVGGVREKLLAAHGAGIGKLILPARNRADVEALKEPWLNELKILYAGTLDDVVDQALI